MRNGPYISLAHLRGSTFTKRSSGCVLIPAMIKGGSKKGAARSLSRPSARVLKPHCHRPARPRPSDRRYLGGDACITTPTTRFLYRVRESSEKPSPCLQIRTTAHPSQLAAPVTPKESEIAIAYVIRHDAAVLTPAVIKIRARQRERVGNQPSPWRERARFIQEERGLSNDHRR